MPQTINLTLPKPHPGQLKVLKQSRRFNVVCCGRRWGKTSMALALLAKPALDGLPVAYLAPTYKMLDEFWREMRTFCAPVARRISEQSKRIELVTGGIIDMWSLDAYESIRGRKYARVVIDEAAKVEKLEDAWNSVVRPTLIDLVGDMYMLSTPRGHNYFWKCYQRGLDSEQDNWACWQMPSHENPYLKPSEIADMLRDVPERNGLQEVHAQFLADGTGVFRNVAACSTGEVIPGYPLHKYVIGCDWGKSDDFSVFSVFNPITKVEQRIDRSNHLDYHLQINRLVALCGEYPPLVIIPEMNSIGVPIIEQLVRRGLPVQPFTMSNATKASIVEGMQLALENKTITLLDDFTATAEMQAFDMERLPSGLWRYAAPSGQHDDTVIARMLAWYGCSAGQVSVEEDTDPFWGYRG